VSTSAPILFLIFNRPDTTARVFEAIRAARPSRLYVAADGPRAGRDGEAERCIEARRVATAVDWPCEVKTLFRDRNLGCGRAVFEAISWFFEREPEGIILEDDILPNATFFDYCAELLERYRDDARVMAVCGGGYGDARCFGRSSYTFARVFDPWGWASWRRAWEKHDAGALGSLGTSKRLLSRTGPTGFDCRAYWLGQFELVTNGAIDTWDYPWMFSIFKARGLVAFPAANQISNLGFRADATHTLPPASGERSHNAERPTFTLSFPLSHPPHVRNNSLYEVDFYTRRLGQARMSPLRALRLAALRRIAAARTKASPLIPVQFKAQLRAWRARRAGITSS
jgi:hypothetical protein